MKYYDSTNEGWNEEYGGGRPFPEEDDNWWANKWEDEADENDEQNAINNDGYCDDYREDFHSDDAVGYVDPFEDGPYQD